MAPHTDTPPRTRSAIHTSEPLGELGTTSRPVVVADPDGRPGGRHTGSGDPVEHLLLAAGLRFEVVHDGPAAACPAHPQRSRRPAA